ncbi:hypothetical protein HAX54_012205 [Datura stramonium]|uniref:Uncharacterized protein n=1 Tax=Datura stramonium TaxID=4076 RepID=A0ABS8Y6S4_DATST|nr:hypothetical protein [Datura stramonium]
MIIVQDENEEHICIVIYGFEISHYDDLLKVFHTYLISMAKVREPSSYAIPPNRFEWIIDKFTIVEEVTENNEDEEPLPLPTKLNTVSFVDIEKQVSGSKFANLLAVVATIGLSNTTTVKTKDVKKLLS